MHRLTILEYGGHKHNERDFEGEAITAFRAVDRNYLVGVGGDRREYETDEKVSATAVSSQLRDNLQQGCEVVDKE